jgi:hypothetical protein
MCLSCRKKALVFRSDLTRSAGGIHTNVAKSISLVSSYVPAPLQKTEQHCKRDPDLCPTTERTIHFRPELG